MKKTWGIIGLGWLGQSLRDELDRLGYPVWGTHRDEFDFASDPLPLRACDVLFLNTPPLRAIEPADFVAKVSSTRATRVIFVSSTSVYAEDGRITEKNAPEPRGASGDWLVAVENGLRQRFGDKLTIVRPGGLIGGERHPVFPLSHGGRAMDDAPVNLIHRTDLIRIILASEHSNVPLVNAVAPHHPMKSAYYNDWAKKYKLAPIRVSVSTPSDRVIESDVLAGLGIDWFCAELDRL